MRFEVAGQPVYAYTGGHDFDSARPTVVFVHGAQHDHSVWILQSRYLAHHGYAVLALDLPAHGRSGGPALETVEEMADWVLEVLRKFGLQRVTLVGHSMGSLIALEAAARAPGTVERIVLIATAYPMKVSDLLLDAARNDERRALEMINIWSHTSVGGGFAHKPSNPGPGFCLEWSNQRLMERQAKGVLLQDFSACNAYANGSVAAQAITQPALVVLGERDAMTPARAGRALASLLRRHRVVELAGVGHAIMGEAPDALLDSMREFLGAHAPAARAQS